MDLNLKNHRVLITGASQGIGLAIAQKFVEEGSAVSICSRSQERVEEALLILNSPISIGQAVDVGKPEQLTHWIENSAKQFGHIDTLVCNVSGINQPGVAGWVSQFEMNILATVNAVQNAVPFMKKSVNPSITMISSIAALEFFQRAGAYASMKAALTNYAGALAQDLAADNIRVNSISPGPILAPKGSWERTQKQSPEVYKSMIQQIPLGCLGSPDDVANQVVFLASEKSKFTTGTNIVIDGGLTRRIHY